MIRATVLPGYSAPGPERCPSGLRSATGNRVRAERSVAGSNPALSASVEGPPCGPSSLRDLELHVHPGLLMARNAAIDVVGAGLQVDGQLRCLPRVDHRRLLVVDAGPEPGPWSCSPSSRERRSTASSSDSAWSSTSLSILLRRGSRSSRGRRRRRRTSSRRTGLPRASGRPADRAFPGSPAAASGAETPRAARKPRTLGRPVRAQPCSPSKAPRSARGGNYRIGETKLAAASSPTARTRDCGIEATGRR